MNLKENKEDHRNMNENPTLEEYPEGEESFTTDAESETEVEFDSDDSSDTEIHGVIGNRPFRFIIEEAARSKLDGIAYGLHEDGQYFLIDKDEAMIRGLIVHCLIERLIEDGILKAITPIRKANESEMLTQEEQK